MLQAQAALLQCFKYSLQCFKYSSGVGQKLPIPQEKKALPFRTAEVPSSLLILKLLHYHMENVWAIFWNILDIKN